MLKQLLLVLSFCFLTFSCEKSTAGLTDAKIIGFESNKCNCCWGWIIQYGLDTIKADGFPDGFTFDHEEFPIHVKIKLGEKTLNCEELGLYNYFQIKRIVKIQ